MNRACLISAAVITAVVLFGPSPTAAQHSHRGGYGRGHVASRHIAAGPVHRATHIGRHALPHTINSRFHARTRVAPHFNIHRRAFRPFVPTPGAGFGYYFGYSYPFYGYRSYGAYPFYGYRTYGAYPLYETRSYGALYQSYERR